MVSMSANTNFRAELRLYNTECFFLSRHIHIGYVLTFFFFAVVLIINLGERIIIIKVELLQLDIFHGQGYSMFCLKQ